MKYCLMICLLMVLISGCMSGAGGSLTAIGKEACKTAGSCCNSLRIVTCSRQAGPDTADKAKDDAYISVSLPEWNMDIFTW